MNVAGTPSHVACVLHEVAHAYSLCLMTEPGKSVGL